MRDRRDSPLRNITRGRTPPDIQLLLLTTGSLIATVLLGLVVLLLLMSQASAAERDESDPWCLAHDGQVEVVLEDLTRVDCLTRSYAVEADWAVKAWSEGVGQALHYARMTDRQPAVLVIVPSTGDCRYVDRLRATIRRWALPVQVFTTGEECPL